MKTLRDLVLGGYEVSEAASDVVTEEVLVFLDELQESGDTNMYGAGAYLTGEFGMTRKDARIALRFWMESFDDRMEDDD